MKKIYFLVLTFCFGFNANSQIVNIPDANFKATLLLQNGNFASGVSGGIIIDANANGEIEVSEALLVRRLFFNSKNIASMVGIQAFANLEWLQCASNQLTSLNLTGLNQLQLLDCKYNYTMTSLTVNGLSNLFGIECTNNALTSLNLTGCNALTDLQCMNNQIASLDISTLPNMVRLSCGNNQIPALVFNTNVVSLEYVSCLNNQLTTLILPPISDSFTSLDCQNNLLTNLSVTGYPNLHILRCQENDLTSLTVSGVPTLQELKCNNNNLTSLTLANVTNLGTLDCRYNQLTSLNLSGIAALYGLYCSFNNLTTLDLSQVKVTNTIACSANPMVSLYMKNGYNEYDSGFNFPYSLRFICVDQSQQSSVQSYVSYTLNLGSVCVVSTYCSFVPGGTYYTLQGTQKFDYNGNGCDSSDLPVPNLKIGVAGSFSGTIIGNTSGSYSVPVTAGMAYLTPILENPTYFTVSPATATFSFPTTPSPHTQNFCLAPNGVHNDLEIKILPMTIARPGFDSHYKIIYRNKGNQTQSGLVNLSFEDSVLDFVASNPSTTNQSLNNLNWSFANLLPFESRTIQLTLNINGPMETPAVNSGSILNYSTTVTSAVDESPNDNGATLAQTALNSQDPNDKTCLEGPTITPAKVGDYVHYIIRFENTGTANAQNIVVKDMIDTTKFDVTSLIPIDASHSFVTRITNTNQVEFIFENIQLPFDDDNNDGYVVFKIKTKPTLVLGNTFSNTASIYFDYNFPIVTNTYTTTVAALANQDFDFDTYFSLYPNPTNDVLNIQVKEGIEVASFSIYNILGQLMMVIPNAKDTTSIDVSSLTTGNYFIKIISDKGTTTAKFIKE